MLKVHKSFLSLALIKQTRFCGIQTSSNAQRLSTVNEGSHSRNNSQFFDLGKWILLLVPCTTLGLGTWQWRRKIWKKGLIHDLKTKTTEEPVPFPADIQDLDNLEYRPLRMRGTFDHSKEMYVGPRSLNTQNETVVTSQKLPDSTGGLLSVKNENVGYHVITPFKLVDRDLVVLINRGFVHRNLKDPSSRSAGQVEGVVEQVGLLRKSEGKPMLGVNNDPKRNNWFYKDLEQMSAYTNSEPILLDANTDSTIPYGPIGGQTRIDLRDEHVSYMITWYGLAICSFALWFKRYYR